jgi:predicted Zn-dependent protease
MHRLRALFFLIFCSCFFLLACGCQKPEKVYNIYFVPIGDAPISEIQALVSHYRQKFGLESTVLPRFVPAASDRDADRQQLMAEPLARSMHTAYAKYLENASSILIGITSEDMYPLSEDWQSCFGWRVGETRSAVVSTARMSLQYEGEPIAVANVTARLEKVVTKDIGILYYHKNASGNPRSVLFNGILGIEELDVVSEDF